MGKLKEELENLWGTWQAVRRDGEWCLHEVLQVLADTCGAVETACRQFAGDDSEWAQLVEDVQWFFQYKLVPLDLPGVGPLLEGLIDAQLVNMVGPLMDRLRPEPHDHG